MIPDTCILLVLILDVAAIPVNAEPSPLYDVAVTTPVPPSICTVVPACND